MLKCLDIMKHLIYLYGHVNEPNILNGYKKVRCGQPVMSATSDLNLVQ